jgi:hypothetical protein
MLHNLPSNPFGNAEPKKPIAEPRLQREQAVLLELLNCGAFPWFLEICISGRKNEQQEIINDTETPESKRTIAVHLRKELEILETWAQRRLEANQAAIQNQKIDAGQETR